MSCTLILGDVHIGKGLSLGKSGVGSSLNSRVVDQVNILEWVLEQAELHLVTNIIITGDIFEEPKPHPTFIVLFLEWLKKCDVYNINVHIIAGNHDVFRSGQFYISPLDIYATADLPNVRIYKDIATLHLNGVSFTLLPFRDRRSFNLESNSEAIDNLKNKVMYEAADIPSYSYKVLVGHLAIEGSIPIGDEFGDLSNELFCPLDMFNEYDYVWMGHVHRPQVLSKKPYISHIGSMDLSDFGESTHKKHIILFDPNNDKVFESIQIPTRPLKLINVSVPADCKDTTKYVIKEINKIKDLSKAIVKVHVKLDSADLLPVNRVLIEDCLLKHGVFSVYRFIEEKKSQAVKKKTDKIDTSVTEISAIKMFAELNIEQDYKDNFISLATEIVNEYYSTIKS